MDKKFDVIIVGGGLVGLSLAVTLAKEDFTVAVVEQKELKPIRLSEDNYQLRVSAINPLCKKIFEKLEIWDAIFSSGRVSAFEHMHVWDNLGKGEIHFDCTKLAQPCLGYIIENDAIQNALLEKLAQYQNVTMITGAKPQQFIQVNDGISLRLENETLTSKLVVGADGPNSWVRNKTNINLTTWPYNHEALVTTVQTELSHQKTAWQCFLPEGPLALLPLPDENLCSIVWSSEPIEIKRLKMMDENEFNQEITSAFEHRLGKITKISNDVTVPLFMRHAKEYVKHRIALIGDAAHTIHPLAGQGVNLGFMDAEALANNVINAGNQQRDFGEYISLREYERKRKSENWVMIIAMDLFKRLFQSEALLAVNVRSAGLNIVDKTNFLKNQFIYHATGLR